RTACRDAASERRCELDEQPVWRIEPIAFDAELVELARAAGAEVAGSDRLLPSGALHDAAELARVLPAAMLFTSSSGGVSHAREEDTPEADLAAAIETFGELANRALARD
ncbi:MAG: M20/M25/M40 family metallo-hydrolase, partial [Thermoleophilaceae bacterium]